MKKYAVAVSLVFLCGLSALAQEEGEGVSPENVQAVEKVGKTLGQIAAEMNAVCEQGRIQDVFDLYRLMKEFGVTYQPTLTAPHHLSGVLAPEQLRMYAGVKLFDALYAATFMQRQDVADCVATIEQIQDTLELRSYADINNYFLHTLKNAADRPEEVDVQQLIEQLSSDYVRELPELLSSNPSAEYLIESLYGFYVEMNFVTSSLMATPAREQMEMGFSQLDTTDTYKLLLDAFEAFNRMDETIRVEGEVAEKLAVMRAIHGLILAESNQTISDEDANPQWIPLARTVASIRASILTPPVE